MLMLMLNVKHCEWYRYKSIWPFLSVKADGGIRCEHGFNRNPFCSFYSIYSPNLKIPSAKKVLKPSECYIAPSAKRNWYSFLMVVASLYVYHTEPSLGSCNSNLKMCSFNYKFKKTLCHSIQLLITIVRRLRPVK